MTGFSQRSVSDWIVDFPFKKIAIIGVGLMGGSFAAALRLRQYPVEIVGFGRTPENLMDALEAGLIDRIGQSFASELPTVDLVLIGVPVRQIPVVLRDILPHLNTQTAIIDVGSTKGDVVRAAYDALGERAAQFIPCHPIAGTEKQGAKAAVATLYEQQKVVITPLAENTETMITDVTRAWQACGAVVYRMTAEEHDRFFAEVSHLPHVLSFALVHDIASRPDADQFFQYAAGGFRDFTRIAASSPEMWRDICLNNRQALLTALTEYEQTLAAFKTAISDSDSEMLTDLFEKASVARTKWGKVRNW